MNHYEKLLRGLMLAKKTGYFKNVFDAVQNGSINIDTLGIEMHDYGREIDINDYSVIIIELNTIVTDSHMYRILRKFGDSWFTTPLLKECDFDQLAEYVYSIDDKIADMIIDMTTNMGVVILGYTLLNIWYIPDFTNINILEDRDELKGRNDKKMTTSEKDIYDKIKEIDDKISEENEKYKRIMDDLEKEKSKLKECFGDLELKYHIFDKINDPHNDKPEDYFTERDIYFYKWVEAMNCIGAYSKLFKILSEKKYHAPEKFKIEDIRPLENLCIIFLLKNPIVINNEVARVLKITSISSRVMHIDYYNKSSLVNSTRIIDENVYYNFLQDNPEINNADKYAVSNYQARPTNEDELIESILESDREKNPISTDKVNTLESKFQDIIHLLQECIDIMKSTVESDK